MCESIEIMMLLRSFLALACLWSPQAAATSKVSVNDEFSSESNADLAFQQTGQTLYGSPPPFSNETETFVEFGTTVALAAGTGHRLAVGAAGTQSSGGQVSLFELSPEGQEWTPLWTLNNVAGHRLSLSADGFLLAVRLPTSIELYQVSESPTLLGEPFPSSTKGDTVTLSPDGSWLAVSEEAFDAATGRVAVYETAGARNATFLVGPQSPARFGWATCFSRSNDVLAVAAPNFALEDDDDAARRGLVRVYQRTSSNGWTQLGNDLVGSEANEQFGFSMSLSANGSTLVVGSPAFNGSDFARGKVSVYQLNNGSWVAVGSPIEGASEKDRLGRSVAISSDGQRIAASSYLYMRQRGVVEVYEYDAFVDAWRLLDAVEGQEPFDRLGWGILGVSLTQDGSRIAAGAVRAKDTNGLPVGKVQVFDLVGAVAPSETPSETPSGTPSFYPSARVFEPSLSSLPSTIPSMEPTLAPIQEIIGFDQFVAELQGPSRFDEAPSEFGKALAIHGKRLAVGAPNLQLANTNTSDAHGGVFLYDLMDDTTWKLRSQLLGKNGEELGHRLSLSADGKRLAIRRNKPSMVEIYDLDELSGDPVLVASPISTSETGNTVTLSYDGTLVAVSVESYLRNVGRVDIYELSGDGKNWTMSASLLGGYREARFGFATSFSASGKRLAVSSPNFIGDGIARIGRVDVFERQGDTWAPLGNTINGTEDSEQLGFSMSLSADGTTLVAGSPGSSSGGIRKGKITAFRFQKEKWEQVGSALAGENDRDRFGRSVTISGDGSLVAASSSFHNKRKGHLRVFQFQNESDWRLLHEVEGQADGDILGFSSVGASMSLDGTRIAVASFLTNGSIPGSVITLDAIIPSAAPSLFPSTAPSELPLSACLCDLDRMCTLVPAVPGELMSLCLETDDAFLFLDVEYLEIMRVGREDVFYYPIDDGNPTAEAEVDITGSSAYIAAPLLVDFFDAPDTQYARVTGIVILVPSDGQRQLESVVTSSLLQSSFQLEVQVEGLQDESANPPTNPPTNPPANPPSSSAGASGMVVCSMLWVLVGLATMGFGEWA